MAALATPDAGEGLQALAAAKHFARRTCREARVECRLMRK